MNALLNSILTTIAAAALLIALPGDADAQALEPNCIPGDVVDDDGNDVPPPRMNNLGFRAGAAGGSSLVLQVEAAAGDIDPTEIEEFADDVINRIRAITDIFVARGLSDYSSCRLRGFLQGAANELQDIVERIVAQCAQEGQIWAELSAALYCDLSAAFGGLVALGLLPKNDDPGLCGAAFEDTCEATFFDVVAGIEDDNGELVDGECPEFSQPPHVEVFEETQANQCLFESPDQP